ncbi:TPA: hypothetical protein JAK05_001467 [Corynebacterium striatum]|nr:hypothetical protein [Corynebacterium striatum]HAT6563594.1 hypothetical protein [Corynebacterium striatum]HAT6569617.1 hypothetical protein [Corynebacterium striatum]
MEHQAALRSTGLRYPTGSRNRVLSHPAHQHTAIKEAELNPGRFNLAKEDHNKADQETGRPAFYDNAIPTEYEHAIGIRKGP